tara:strand:+ start:183 stop:395 length:213 start_codon:yes stop_codon:yes gene_type:complete
MAEFQFIINGELVTFDKYEDIPDEFEHVIKFLPDIPEPVNDDHTDEEHEELAKWNDRLQELMEKERARSL